MIDRIHAKQKKHLFGEHYEITTKMCDGKEYAAENTQEVAPLLAIKINEIIDYINNQEKNNE